MGFCHQMKTTPLLLLAMCVAVAFLAWRGDRRVHEDRGRLAVFREGDAVVLQWRSDVDVPMARRFEEAYREWGGETERFIIDLDSPGGALTEGRAVIDVLQRMKRTHALTTYVGPGAACMSMCAPIYLQGENRLAAASSRWLFHEPAARNVFNGERVRQPGFEERRRARRFFERYFVNSEMDPVWRARLEEEWKGRDVRRTGRELFEEGANIVLELEDG